VWKSPNHRDERRRRDPRRKGACGVRCNSRAWLSDSSAARTTRFIRSSSREGVTRCFSGAGGRPSDRFAAERIERRGGKYIRQDAQDEQTMTTQRSFLAPKVVQNSAMDCGPAALKCLLEGFAISVGYEPLRESCQTGVDGTSMNRMEEVAQ